MKEVIRHLTDGGILPIITLDEPLDAIPIGQALSDGGMSMVVITFRSESGPDSISLITKALPHLLVGAGTVFTTEQVDSAIEAGARFITSPSINPTVVRYCQEKGIPIIPGVSSPSNIETALTLGLTYMEYFPAEANGGIEGIRAVSEPYPNVHFLANGGIYNGNVVEYLKDPKVFAVGGDWFVKKEWIRDREYEKIEIAARAAIEHMLDFGIDHVGVNFPKNDGAVYAAEEFAEIFGHEVREEEYGFYAGEYFETMKPGARGVVGHISIATNSVERAMAYLRGRGIEFEESTTQYADGHIQKVYLTREIGGMAIQLVRKGEKKGENLVFSGIHPHSLIQQIERKL